jgi:hypothetical protein
VWNRPLSSLMAPGSSVHSARVHVPHSSPDTVRARDTARDIGDICASNVQCNGTLQSAMTIRFAVHRNKTTAGSGSVGQQRLVLQKIRVQCRPACHLPDFTVP